MPPAAKTKPAEVVEPKAPLNTAEDIAQGKPTAQYILTLQGLQKTLKEKGEGRIEALATGFGVTKTPKQSWADKLGAIAEAQLESMGLASYETATGVNSGSTAQALSAEPVAQAYAANIKTAANGDKLRTRLYGTGLAS